MILAISGSRYRRPDPAELLAFGRLWRARRPDVLRHGAARGTDSFVACRALLRGLPVQAYPVDPALDGPWPAAGHRRNRRMLLGNAGAGPADELAAFWGERGTAGAVREALRLGMPVWGWDWREEAFTAVLEAKDWQARCQSDRKARREAEAGKGGPGRP